VTLKTSLGVRQGYWKYHPLIEHIRRSIETMALSRIVSEIFNVEKCRDLEIWVRGHSRCHRKWHHLVDRVWFPISVL